MLDSCFETDMVVEITMQPVRRHRSTRRSSSPTSSCRSRRSASTSTSCLAQAPSWPTDPLAAQLDQLRDLERDDVASVPAAVTALTGRARVDPADRLRRRSVHARFLPRGGRSVEGPPPHQAADVLRPRSLARPARPDRRDRRPVPAPAGRGWRFGRAAVRLVGGHAVARRLRHVCAAALGCGARLRRRPRRPAHPLRRRHRRDPRCDVRRGRRCRGRRLARAAGRGGPPARPGRHRAGQPRPDHVVCADRRRARPGGGDHRPGCSRPRPHLQPRPRGAAGHRPRHADPPRRLRAPAACLRS